MTLVTMAIDKKVVYNLKLSQFYLAIVTLVMIDHVWANNPTLGEFFFIFPAGSLVFFCVIIEKKSYKRMVRAAKDFSSVKIMFNCTI